MNFKEKMARISEDYDKKAMFADSLTSIKRSIERRVQNGDKKISDKNLICTLYNKKGAKIAVHGGAAQITVEWAITPEIKAGLQELKDLAAEEGITIAGFRYRLSNWCDDNSLGFGPVFTSGSGIVRVSKFDRAYRAYRSDVRSAEDWSVSVYCDYEFSL